jgi:hypothetical protein
MAKMQRNAGLIRDILLSVEVDHADIETDVTNDQDIINHHLHLMIDGGLLNGKEINEGQWRLYGLTWEGHELLELIRNRWDEIKRVLDNMNCYNFEIIEQIARRLLEWRKM